MSRELGMDLPHRNGAPMIDFVCIYGLSQEKQQNLFIHVDSYSTSGLEGDCLHRFPEDETTNALSPLLHYFAFPTTIKPVKKLSDEQNTSTAYHSFVMTDIAGTKYYGFCLSRWNRCNNAVKCYAPVSLVIVSHRCLHNSFLCFFSNILDQLSYNWKTIFDVSMCEEVYTLFNRKLDLVTKVHFSGSQKRTVFFTDYDELILQPVENGKHDPEIKSSFYPTCDVDFRILINYIQLPHLLYLIESLISERQIILYSTHAFRTTSILEAVIALLYPMTWAHVYITTLPPNLYHFLEAPVPYLVGTDTGHFVKTFLNKKFENDSDIVDLPVNCISLCIDDGSLHIVDSQLRLVPHTPPESLFPPFLSSKLRTRLEEVYSREADMELLEPTTLIDQTNISWGKRASIRLNTPGQQSNIDYYLVKYSIRRTFLSCFVKVLKLLRKHIHSGSDATKYTFDKDQYIHETCQLYEHCNNDTSQTIKFLSELTNSQSFHYLVQRTVQEASELKRFLLVTENKLLKLRNQITNSEVEIIKGWLYKRGQIRKSWKKRWFVLNETGQLNYYTNEQAINSKGVLDVHQSDTCNQKNQFLYHAYTLDKKNTNKINVSDFPTEFPFLLRVGTRVMYVCAETNQERCRWLTVLRAHLMDPQTRNKLVEFIESETVVPHLRRRRMASRIKIESGLIDIYQKKTFVIDNHTINSVDSSELFMQFLLQKSNSTINGNAIQKITTCKSTPGSPTTHASQTVSLYFKNHQKSLSGDLSVKDMKQANRKSKEGLYVIDDERDQETNLINRGDYQYEQHSLEAQMNKLMKLS
ncbi:hypothetical protein AKO1_011510 [Acrasis kona]|uniref:Uncharacterized protein n=1 Tax=Acrasis kona TaxID=1008807 RepID=A0AAW2Z2M7_9EUKA